MKSKLLDLVVVSFIFVAASCAPQKVDLQSVAASNLVEPAGGDNPSNTSAGTLYNPFDPSITTGRSDLDGIWLRTRNSVICSDQGPMMDTFLKGVLDIGTQNGTTTGMYRHYQGYSIGSNHNIYSIPTTVSFAAGNEATVAIDTTPPSGQIWETERYRTACYDYALKDVCEPTTWFGIIQTILPVEVPMRFNYDNSVAGQLTVTTVSDYACSWKASTSVYTSLSALPNP